MNKNNFSALLNRMGFTMIETIIVLVIIIIIVGISIPTFTIFIPNYRLKSAAQDLYGHMQTAKIEAIKKNGVTKMTFNTTNGTYKKADEDIIDLKKEYKGSVSYGRPDGTAYATYDGSPPELKFNSRGMTTNDSKGAVYLTNVKGNYYMVGTNPTGAILLRKWNGKEWE